MPLVAARQGVPLVRTLDLSASARFERYSDFGDTAKPKVALAWDVIDGVRFRGSWAQGFRAPNLEQTNATVVTRANSRTDYIMCEADVRAGRITDFSQCSRAQTTSARRSGWDNGRRWWFPPTPGRRR